MNAVFIPLISQARKDTLIRVYAFFIISVIFFVGTASFAHAKNITINQSTLSETKTQINQLLKLQDDTTIPTEEKEQREIFLRRDILIDIITIAQTQADDAYKRLNSLSFNEDKSLQSIQKTILQQLNDAILYYKDTNILLATDTALTIDNLKTIAKELDQKKSGSIDRIIQEANTISALFHIETLLTIASDRLKKIEVDVEKIYSQKLTTNQTVQTLFLKASELLADAHTLHNNTKDILEHLYNPDPIVSDAYAKSLYKNLLDQKVIISSISTTTPTTTTYTSEILDSYIQKSFATIVTNIKGAYTIFLQMSAEVKEYLK
jgi:hypothetical protein